MRSLPFLAPLTLALGASLFTACGGSTDQPNPTSSTTSTTGSGGAGGDATTTTAASTGGGGAGGDMGPDIGEPSDKYPGPHSPAPKVVNLGGPVLAAPVVVPVFWSNDQPTIVAQIKDFEEKVGATDYWKATTKEYGVGVLKAAPAIDLPEPAPANITDAQIQAWLADKLNSDDPAFPVADKNTVYGLHYPKGTIITAGSGAQTQKSCEVFGGYHSSITLDAAHGGQRVAYMVMPRCANFNGLTGIDVMTATESHELIEAATDPYPQDIPAYGTVDSAHFYWAFVLGGGETADMCAQWPGADTTFPELDYVVQRSWSNKAASAGHNPCVPVHADSGPYFNAVPVFKDVISLAGGKIKGLKIPVGESKSIDIQLFSDADTGGPFTVQALTDADFWGGPKELDFTWDQDSGQNGQTLHLTVEVLKGNSFNAQFFYLVSTLGQEQNYWIGVVGNK